MSSYREFRKKNHEIAEAESTYLTLKGEVCCSPVVVRLRV
jgi:hypothetical protein